MASKETASPDCSDDQQPVSSDNLIEVLARRHPDLSKAKIPPTFAELQGSNVLLAMGVVLFVLGCGAFVVGRTTIASAFIAFGVLAVIVATGLARLVVLKLDFLKLIRFIVQFGAKGTPENEAGPETDEP